MAAHDIYAGKDPRDLPVYSVADAAFYLRMPASTLREWVQGMSYQTKAGPKRTRPLIVRPRLRSGRPRFLSFFNLVEAHVLAEVRREHGVSLKKVRTAIEYVKLGLEVERPLLQEEFQTDGVSLFVERFGGLVNASEQGQMTIRAALEQRLQRIEHDVEGLAERIFPWFNSPTEPKRIEIDSRRAFGQPTLVGTGIRVDVVADRFMAGDSVGELAKDFGINEDDVQVAVRWGMNARPAA